MIVGSIIGFLGSLLPEGVKYFQDRADKKHELEILKFQMEHQDKSHDQRLTEIVVEGDVQQAQEVYRHDASFRRSYKWVDALRASVRPVIAYSFFILYALVEILIMVNAWMAGILLVDAIDVIWTVIDVEIFASIISFYFGRRGIEKVTGRSQ